MPTTLTGNPAGSGTTSPVPALNAVPAESVPVDGDPPNAAAFVDLAQTSLDFNAWLAAREITGPWGDGSDGSLTVAGTTIIAGNKLYSDLSIGAAGLLIVGTGGVIRVKGTLNITSGGKITSGAADGNLAVSSLRGTGGVGWDNSAAGALLGGANGGGGADVVPTTSDPGQAVVDSIGGSGGQGGGSGSVGGVATALDQSICQSILAMALNGGWGFKRGGSAGARTALPIGLRGGAGGGGGAVALATSNSAGGGGGSGGNVLIVIARKVVIAADGALSAAGGNGGDGFQGQGGGGGGGGGVILIYGTKTGPALTAAVSSPGGVGGIGFANGVAGSVGTVHEFNLGY